MNKDRELDVVVFGATGFTGRLIAGYLADVRSQLPAAAAAWPPHPR